MTIFMLKPVALLVSRAVVQFKPQFLPEQKPASRFQSAKSF